MCQWYRVNYGSNESKKQIVHLVVCKESWQGVAKDSAEIVTMHSRHAWISSNPLDKFNVHKRCNLGARHRWCIETGFLVEIRHACQYEHMFAYNWNAMKGYHYLRRLGHLINILSHNSERLVEMARELGVRGFIHASSLAAMNVLSKSSSMVSVFNGLLPG
jgi:hypothetical protein